MPRISATFCAQFGMQGGRDSAKMATPMSTLTPTPSSFGDLPMPAQIGKYPVLRRLGEGATSEVFLARDDFHQRDVAIKRVRSGASNDPGAHITWTLQCGAEDGHFPGE